jgi:hypothetical protein
LPAATSTLLASFSKLSHPAVARKHSAEQLFELFLLLLVADIFNI